MSTLDCRSTSEVLIRCFSELASAWCKIYEDKLVKPREVGNSTYELRLRQGRKQFESGASPEYRAVLRAEENELIFPIYEGGNNDGVLYSFSKKGSYESSSALQNEELSPARDSSAKSQPLQTAKIESQFVHLNDEDLEALSIAFRECARSIFRPLENIVLIYGTVECLNSSFRIPIVNSVQNPGISTSHHLFEVENPPDSNIFKAPEQKYTELANINYSDVEKWYDYVLEDWSAFEDIFEQTRRDREEFLWHKLHGASLERKLQKLMSSVLQEIQRHIQRVVLKVSEKLLVRPRVPLDDPNNVRFLIFISYNPLIFSKQSNKIQHPNITKRFLGLIAQLPDRTKRRYKQWLLSVKPSRLRSLVETTQALITHRLGKACQKLNDSRHLYQEEYIEIPTKTKRVGKAGSVREHKTDPSTAKKTLVLPPYCEDWQLKAAARFMSLLFWTNESWLTDGGSKYLGRHQLESLVKSKDQTILQTAEFYNLVLDFSDNLKKYFEADFKLWEAKWHHPHNKFTFCEFPFLLSMSAKIKLLKYDYQRQIVNATQNSWTEQLLSRPRQGGFDLYNTIRIRRDCLVEDSMREVDRVTTAWDVSDSKKKLRVEFVGEEGIDAGGVSKEWLHLALRDLFDPDYGRRLLI